MFLIKLVTFFVFLLTMISPEPDLKKLLAGEVVSVVEQKGETKIIKAQYLIHHSPEIVWRVITEFEKHETYLPNMKSCKILKKTETDIFLDITLDIPFSSIRYENHMQVKEKNRWLVWTAVKGDFKKNTGYWKVIPHEKSTILEYYLELEYPSMVPDWMMNILFNKDLPNLYKSIEKRSTQLSGK